MTIQCKSGNECMLFSKPQRTEKYTPLHSHFGFFYYMKDTDRDGESAITVKLVTENMEGVRSSVDVIKETIPVYNRHVWLYKAVNLTIVDVLATDGIKNWRVINNYQSAMQWQYFHISN